MSGTVPTEEAARELLQARARALAKPLAPERSRDQLQLLAFSLGGERYGVELRYVVQVFRLRSLSLLPGAAAPTLGVTAWRGELLPVLDLRQILGLSARGLDELGFAIVLGDERAPLAVLADSVSGILAADPEQVIPPPAGVAARRDFVRGVTGDALLVLDAQRLLETQR